MDLNGAEFLKRYYKYVIYSMQHEHYLEIGLVEYFF